MKSQKGFTLIELLLVLAIIGIISSVAVPALLGQREKAKIRATQALGLAAASEIPGAVNMLTTSTTTPTASAVITAVLKASNLKRAKNPYGGSTPFVAAATGSKGQVALEAVSNYSDPVSGLTAAGIKIHAVYSEGGTVKSTIKFIAVD